jgi:hypothetical protein
MADERTIRIPDRVMTRHVGGETVLLNLETETYYGLDDIGTDILNLLQAGSTVDEAVSDLTSRWDVAPARLQRDLCDLVDALVEQGLAEWQSS